MQRLTDGIGYDGGPFFSPDGSKIVYRAHHPTDPAEIEDYRNLLADGLIRPSKLEIWVMDADGSNKRQITELGVASFAPYFHPSGEKIIFSSNFGDPSGREFDLWMVDLRGEPGAHHLHRGVRRLPDVVARRHDLRLLLQPQQLQPGRDQCLRDGVEGLNADFEFRISDLASTELT